MVEAAESDVSIMYCTHSFNNAFRKGDLVMSFPHEKLLPSHHGSKHQLWQVSSESAPGGQSLWQFHKHQHHHIKMRMCPSTHIAGPGSLS